MPNEIQHCKRGREGKVKLANLPNTSVCGCCFSDAFLLVHDYFVAGTVCKSSAHDATLQIGDILLPPHAAEFKPAELHAT